MSPGDQVISVFRVKLSLRFQREQTKATCKNKTRMANMRAAPIVLVEQPLCSKLGMV